MLLTSCPNCSAILRPVFEVISLIHIEASDTSPIARVHGEAKKSEEASPL